MENLKTYYEIVAHYLKQAELESTLEQDMLLLRNGEEKSINFKFVLVYRSERKKILHSQLHLLEYLLGVVESCQECESAEDFPDVFRRATFERTEFERR